MAYETTLTKALTLSQAESGQLAAQIALDAEQDELEARSRGARGLHSGKPDNRDEANGPEMFKKWARSVGLMPIQKQMARWDRSHWHLIKGGERCAPETSTPEERAAVDDCPIRIILGWAEKYHKKSYNSQTAETILDTFIKFHDAGGSSNGFRECNVIPCNNGWIEAQPDGALRVVEPDMDLRVFHTVGVDIQPHQVVRGNYVPKELPEDSLFWKFISSSLPEPELRESVRQYCAYTLLAGRGTKQIAQYWQGIGRDGKGTMIEIMVGFHGEGVSTLNMKTIGTFGLAPLLGSTLCVVDEFPKHITSDEASVLKKAIGESQMTIDIKFKSSVTYVNRAKFIFASNDPLNAADASHGFWERFHIIPWRHSRPEHERIEGLAERILAEEKHLVFDWLMAGLINLKANGGRLVDAGASVKLDQKIGSNNVLRFILESELVCSSNADREQLEVYEAYRQATEARGGKPCGDGPFWSEIQKHFPGYVKHRASGKTANGMRARPYVSNIVFLEDDPTGLMPTIPGQPASGQTQATQPRLGSESAAIAGPRAVASLTAALRLCFEAGRTARYAVGSVGDEAWTRAGVKAGAGRQGFAEEAWEIFRDEAPPPFDD